MTDLDREQLKRACSEALKAVQQDKGVDGLVPLAFTIADLGPAYRAHGTLNAGRAGGTEGHHGHLASGAAARRTEGVRLPRNKRPLGGRTPAGAVQVVRSRSRVDAKTPGVC